MGSDERLIPAERAQAEILVVNSRFFATLGPALSVEEARLFIARYARNTQMPRTTCRLS